MTVNFTEYNGRAGLAWKYMDGLGSVAPCTTFLTQDTLCSRIKHSSLRHHHHPFQTLARITSFRESSLHCIHECGSVDLSKRTGHREDKERGKDGCFVSVHGPQSIAVGETSFLGFRQPAGNAESWPMSASVRSGSHQERRAASRGDEPRLKSLANRLAASAKCVPSLSVINGLASRKQLFRRLHPAAQVESSFGYLRSV